MVLFKIELKDAKASTHEIITRYTKGEKNSLREKVYE